MLVTNFKLKAVLYRIVCAGYQVLDVGRIHPMRERSLRALDRTVDYIEKNMPGALGFESQHELINFSLRQVKIHGHYLEFGVFTGGTMRYMAKRARPHVFHGFDSFEGLPEPWSGFYVGTRGFDVKKRLPRVPQNVRLHPGWFDESLPKWLERNAGPVAFMHVDCDIYSSTRTVLTLLAERIVPGTLILFDEYFNYPNWEKHEHQAFQEFVTEHAVKYCYLAFARQQVAVVIESIQHEQT